MKFVLSAIKSIWLLDQLELNSSFGWLPRKIRDLSVMLLHKHAEYFERFFNLGLSSPSLIHINRFGDFSFKIPVHIVEETARTMHTTEGELDMGDGHYIGQRSDLHLVSLFVGIWIGKLTQIAYRFSGSHATSIYLSHKASRLL